MKPIKDSKASDSDGWHDAMGVTPASGADRPEKDEKAHAGDDNKPNAKQSAAAKQCRSPADRRRRQKR